MRLFCSPVYCVVLGVFANVGNPELGQTRRRAEFVVEKRAKRPMKIQRILFSDCSPTNGKNKKRGNKPSPI